MSRPGASLRSAPSRGAILSILLLVLSACGQEPAGDIESTPKPRRPNVLIIVMDTTRADHLGVHGHQSETSPNLDRLASESTVFRNAWSPCSWTGPSHASLFTGLTAPRHGFQMGNRLFLAEEAVTLAEILRAEGYRTACLSNNHIVSPDWGLAQGFEIHIPFYQFAPRTVSQSMQTHRRAAAWAREMHGRGERFFLFINDMEPHLPYTPPEPFESRFLPEGVDRKMVEKIQTLEPTDHTAYCLGEIDFSREELEVLRSLYGAEVATLDASIGWLIEQLRDEGILDDTLVVVTADHGEALGEKHMVGHILSLNRWLLHVPLLIRFPDVFPPGRVEKDTVRLQDVMPTCLEICGFEIPEGLDALSLTGDLRGRIATAALGPPIGVELQAEIERAGHERFARSLRSVFDGDYQYIVDSAGNEELYDVRADPDETRNLAEALPDVLEAMRKRLPSRAAGRPGR